MNNKTGDKSYCLKCAHEGEVHAELQDCFDRFMYWLILGRRIGCTVGKWCNCPQYIPNDNLKYLEELEARRNK